MATNGLSQRDLADSLPVLTGRLDLPGLLGAVEVWRDRWGIPHLRAGSVPDAFFAQGFVHAQDRLWAMDADRRRALGRFAAVAGPANLEQDLLMRRFRLEASSRADYDLALSGETRTMLDAYSMGVNAFLAWSKETGRLPVEYRLIEETPEPWQPWHSLLVYKVRHVQMGVWEAKAWRARLVNQIGPEAASKLLTGYAQGQPLVLPPGSTYQGPPLDGLEELTRGAAFVALVTALGGQSPRPTPFPTRSGDAGSNNWAVAGTRTSSGFPLVAGDPHRALDVPNVYYQNHLACPDFDVVGYSFAGVPAFPHYGHNSSVAWSITHAQADYQDLFIEQFDTGDPSRYRYLEGWRTAQRFNETVEVRGAAPVKLDVTVTHHGPLILGDPEEGFAVAFRYTATAEPNGGFNALLPMLRATSAAEMDEAMRPWVDPANNFVFADMAGTIAYRTRGQLPVRSPANAWLPVPGWTGEHEWQGAVPFEEMPSLQNPESGFLVSANNRIAGDQYPHYIALDYSPGFRAQRIVHRLRTATGLTPEDMTDIHADQVSVPGTALARLIEQVRPSDETTMWARERLMEWDGGMRPSAVAPLIYSIFREQLLENLMTPILGPLAETAFSGTGRGGPSHMGRLRARLGEMIEAGDRTLLPAGTDWPEAMGAALERSMERLRHLLGEDRGGWRWDMVHRTKPVHPLSPAFPDLASLLDPPPVGIGGDAETVAAAGFASGYDFSLTSTSVARYVFDLSNWNRCGWVVPLGASGHPGSPHYSDQVTHWSQYHLVPMLYDWEQIDSTAESRQSLVAQTNNRA